MKLKYSFEIIDMGEELIAVPVGESANHVRGVLKMNREGAEIMQLLGSETDMKKIVDTLASKYDNDPNSLNKFVRSFVENLRSSGLLND